MTGLPLVLLLAAAGPDAPGSVGEPTEGPPAGAVAGTLAVAPGLTVELAAAEPLVVDPVALRFDERGRAWVVEMGDYPTPPPDGFSEANPPRGRVRILEDTNGDGTFDAATTFADRLVFPTGVQPWKGGAFVTSAGKLSYFPDESGPGGTPDDRADGEEVWFTGFAEENEQLRANHPTLGPDGLIYVGNGLRGGKISRGDAHPRLSRTHASGLGGDENDDETFPLDLSGRTFAFDPHTGAARVVAGAGQYGLSIDAFGNRFFCSNRRPVLHAVLPDDVTALNPHLAVESAVHEVAASGPESRLFATQQGFTTSLAHAGQFTAACGVLKLPSGALSEAFANSVFTCEPTAGLVHREVLTPRGATFASEPAREGVEFLTSTSEWFRPVDLTVGPDGSLYVVDMARAVIEHPHWMPEELKDRPDLRWGDTRGRLWRVRAAGEPFAPPTEFARNPAALAEALDDANPWRRATASRLLLESRDPAAIEPVRAVLENGGRPGGRASAATYLAAAGALEERDVVRGLGDAPRVAGATARVASDHELLTPAVRAAVIERLPTAEPRLAFDLCLALAPHADQPAAFEALVDAAVRSGDPYLHTVVLAGAGRAGRPTPLTAALWLSDTPAPLALLERSAEVAGRRGDVRATMGMAVDSILAERIVSDRAAAVLRGLDRGAGSALRKELATVDERDAETLAATFLDRLDRPDAPADDLFLLSLLPATRPALVDRATGDADPAARAAAVRLLARGASDAAPDDPAVGLIHNLPAETPAVRAALLDLALTAPPRAAALLTLVEEGELSAAALGPSATRRLLKHGDAAIRERATAALSGGSADRSAVLARYRSSLEAEGDVARGRAVFARACATCHAIDGVGTAVGADVSDTYNRTPENLLTNILDPNRAVDVGGFAYTVLTADGRVLTGLLTSETAGSLTLLSPGGESVTLPRGEVLELNSEGVSLMPVGLENQITPEQMTDLIAFLKGWRYGE